jgi:hypothetical protein
VRRKGRVFVRDFPRFSFLYPVCRVCQCLYEVCKASSDFRSRREKRERNSSDDPLRLRREKAKEKKRETIRWF